MKLLWATRGRAWGFRFLKNGGFLDPLPEYDKFFSSLGDAPEAWRRTPGGVALRFPDPEGRRDRAGRVIPHEFVVFAPDADRIDSLEVGRRLVWDEVKDIFERWWASPEPPSVQ